MERINDTTESYTTHLENLVLIVINMKNDFMQHKYQLNCIDEKYTFHQITPQINLHGMGKGPLFKN